VVFSAAVLWPFALAPSLRSAKPLVQWLRSGLMVVTTGFNFVALRYLQLDQTITIFFLTPLVVIYLGLISMSVAGFLVFGDVPTLWTLTGAAIVILSGLYLLARERKAVGVAGPASDIATQ